ncbi:hypothetical protein M3Y96_01062600 [Aphelenchoides besseyi]|nr:hypothetical protein M3Y96_01062600 [Aphelenchoides besseyi]
MSTSDVVRLLAFWFLIGVLVVETTFARIEPSPTVVSTTGRRNEKVLLRTKRQHCTCLNVRFAPPGTSALGPGLDPLDSTYRCTNPIQQQRELQQILQQVEPLSHCSCTPGGLGEPPVASDSPYFELQQQQQQWDCTCIGGQTQRPSPPQFFPWNRPTANAAPIRQQNRQEALPPPQYLPNDFNQQNQYASELTTVPPPIAALAPSTPGYAQSSKPLLPLPPDLQNYRDPNTYEGPIQQTPPSFPLRQNQVPTYRVPEGNGIVDSVNNLPPLNRQCPCMEVIVSVIRSDPNGQRYPSGNPLCLCSPNVAINNGIQPNYNPVSSPVLNNPVRQPLVPPQPDQLYFPRQRNQPSILPEPTLTSTPFTTPLPTPQPTLPSPTPAPRPPIVSPASLPYSSTSNQNLGRSYYDIIQQPFRPAPVYPTYSYGPPPVNSIGPFGWLIVLKNYTVRSLADEVPVTPCVMITIGGLNGGRRCSCQENYRQCSPTQCCNHKSYRSLRQGEQNTTSTTPSAVDLLLEFADQFKKHWNAQKST